MDFDNPPLNRCERYWSATVLPLLIASDNFAHCGRFLQLIDRALGRGPAPQTTDPLQIRLETEYSLKTAEAPLRRLGSISGPAERGDTPDLLIWAGPPPTRFYAIEVKMFDAAGAEDVIEQLANQRRFAIEPMVNRYGVAELEIRHIALLPQERVAEWGQHLVPVLTWEDIREEFTDLHQSYFWQALDRALTLYPDRASPSELSRTARSNGNRTGKELLVLHNTEVAPRWVGRGGGLDGDAFRADLRSGRWATYQYQVNFLSGTPPSTNWFTLDDFVSAVRSSSR